MPAFTRFKTANGHISVDGVAIRPHFHAAARLFAPNRMKLTWTRGLFYRPCLQEQQGFGPLRHIDR